MRNIRHNKNKIILTLFLAASAAVWTSVYGAAGDLDTAFNAGAVTRDGLTTSIESIAVLPNGKVLIGGGFDSVGGTARTFIARLNVNGSIDPAFSAPLQKFGGGTLGSVRSVVVQPDGKILVGGSFQIGVDIKMIVRLNADGSLDGTFNSDGGGSFAQTIVPQPDGKIIVAGQLGNFGGVQSRGLVRLNPNGTLETALGLAADLQNNIFAVALQADGKIVVGGNTFVGGTTPTQNNIARLNANGTLDTAFAVGTGANNTVNALAVQPDGKILAGGFFTSFNGTARATVARLNTDGSVEPTFAPNIIGGGGVFTIFLQSRGKILIGGGLGSVNGQTRSGLARFNSDGSLDSFYPSGGAINNLVRAVAYQSCGKILIGGNFTSVGGTARQHLARLFDAITPTAFDFDADGCTDVSVFRPSNGVWYLNRSTDGFSAVQFGLGTDLLAPADFDGDGKTDVAVFRDGNWYILQSSNNAFTSAGFGSSNDLPRPGDFDGDGRADICVFRPSNGAWYRLNSSNNQFVALQFGQNGDKPMMADFDGDGRSDVSVFRPSNGVWYYLNSSNNAFGAVAFGISTDIPQPGDFDGDGKTDVSIYRASMGIWYRLNSSNGQFAAAAFGISEDLPVAGDYDGDGKTDIAVFRPSVGAWYLLQSQNGFSGQIFGISSDIPVPLSFSR